MDRQEAIERIKQNKAAAEYFAQTMGNYGLAENELKDIEAFNMAIEALQDDWIPVSERLPEVEEEVILTDGNSVGIDWMSCWNYELGDYRWEEALRCISNTQDWYWRPLPAPYKESEE